MYLLLKPKHFDMKLKSKNLRQIPRLFSFHFLIHRKELILFLFGAVFLLSSCYEGNNDFKNLKVTTGNDPISVSIDGIVNFKLIKKTINWQNNSVSIVDTSQLLLTIENLTSEDLSNVNFWIIGYNSVRKRNEDINFIYQKDVSLLSTLINLGEINTTYKGLDNSLTYRFFDIEIGGVYGISSPEYAGLYNSSVSFFKNDTIEVGATTGICQINYLGYLKFLPEDEDVFSKFSGILTNNGNFYGELESQQGVFFITTSDTAAFTKNGNQLSAIIIPDEFLIDSITRIDLNMSTFLTVNQ